MKLFVSIFIAILIVSGAVVFVSRDAGSPQNPRQESEGAVNNVTIADGKQIIAVKARGGYYPRVSVAQAGIPTIIRFSTNGTFDCSAAVRIPALNVYTMLPSSGTKDIDIGTPKAGALQVMCGMGMYYFTVKFN